MFNNIIRCLSVLTIAAIISCSHSGGDKSQNTADSSTDQETGSLALSINQQSRTILPDITITAYDISGTGPGGATFIQENVSGSSITINELVAGAWSVTANGKNSSGSVIASGSAAVTIALGQVASQTITVRPIDGQGSLNLTLSWPAEIASPVIEATLAPVDTPASTTPLSFTIAGTSASYAQSGINDGYYLLNITLKDGSNTVWNFGPEVVRIIAQQTTSHGIIVTSQEISSNSGLNLHINVDMGNTIIIAFSGQQNSLEQGIEMTVTAATSETVSGYTWYLDGAELSGETSSSLTIGSALSLGKHRLVLVVTNGSVYSSKSLAFTVIDSTITEVPAHMASKVAFTDINFTENVLSGTVTIFKAFNETDISGYRLYWGSSITEKLAGYSVLADFSADGLDKTHTFTNVSRPVSATHLLAYAYNSNGENSTPTATVVTDRILQQIFNNSTTTFDPTNMVVFDNKLYFSAYDSAHGRELWVYDGINNPTMVADINTQGDSSPQNFIVYNNKLYFAAKDYNHGNELWVFDGHNDLHMVSDINGSSSNSNPCYFTILNGTLYFIAANASGVTRIFLYTEAAGVVEVTGTYYGPTNLVTFNNQIFFSGSVSAGKELLSYDGINNPVTVYNTYYDAEPQYLTVANNILFYSGYSGVNSHSENGLELWFYPGTGNPQFIELSAGSTSSTPQWFTEFNGKIYFMGLSGASNRLWVFKSGSDIQRVQNSDTFSSPQFLKVYNNKLYFSAYSSFEGIEFWSFDENGIPSIAANISPSSSSSSPSNLTIYNNKLYFSATNGTNGRALWVYFEK